MYRIHPSFRIIALAEPPKQGVASSNANKWLDSELLTLFMYHHMPPLSHHQELKVLNGMVGFFWKIFVFVIFLLVTHVSKHNL